MIWLLCFVLGILTSPFKSKIRLEAENAVLRHQLTVLRRKMPGRPWLMNNDRPDVSMVSFDPEGRDDYPALVRWHRAGFRFYWRWKLFGRRGRPEIETELRALIRRMGIENPLWGAPWRAV
jgi:hypothetical protein